MMVFEEKLSWWRIVFQLRGAALARIWGRLLLTTTVAAVVTYAHTHGLLEHSTLTIAPFTLIGVALGIFLGFRNNTSYQRFWEGRILWGRLVNTSRSLTRQILTLITPGAAQERETECAVDLGGEGGASSAECEEVVALQRSLVHTTAAYAHALRLHLRREPDGYPELGRLMSDPEPALIARTSNPPIAILQRMAERLTAAYRRGWVHPYHLPVLEDSLTQLTDIQGGCERIKNTPIPFSYTLVLHRLVGIYCLALPMGIVHDAGLATPFVVLLVSYAFFGLDAIGDEIEDPFGRDAHDLPLLALSTMIEINVRERLGDRDLPATVQPVRNVLT